VARTWLKVEGALGRHPKVRMLAERYGVHPYLVVGFLLAWWDYCAEFARPFADGSRTVREPSASCPRAVLAEFAAPLAAASREVVVPDIVDALKEVGLMDAAGAPNDWQVYTGALLARRARDADRVRASRDRPRTVREQSANSRALEQSRVEYTPPPRARGDDPAAVVRAHLSAPEYIAAFEGLVRAAQRPEALAASIRAMGPGGIHETATWEQLGQALHDAAAAGGRVTPNTLRGFLRRAPSPWGMDRPPGETGYEQARRLREQVERETNA
jgi:hypothetical protein